MRETNMKRIHLILSRNLTRFVYSQTLLFCYQRDTNRKFSGERIGTILDRYQALFERARTGTGTWSKYNVYFFKSRLTAIFILASKTSNKVPFSNYLQAPKCFRLLFMMPFNSSLKACMETCVRSSLCFCF